MHSCCVCMKHIVSQHSRLLVCRCSMVNQAQAPDIQLPRMWSNCGADAAVSKDCVAIVWPVGRKHPAPSNHSHPATTTTLCDAYGQSPIPIYLCNSCNASSCSKGSLATTRPPLDRHTPILFTHTPAVQHTTHHQRPCCTRGAQARSTSSCARTSRATTTPANNWHNTGDLPAPHAQSGA
jgi:hypothetical protein